MTRTDIPDPEPEAGVDPEISRPTRSAVNLGEGDPSAEVIRRLEAHALRETRYELRGEVARGGMGVILRVWDEDLRRNLAMKVVLGHESGGEAAKTKNIKPKTLGRFLEEAQVTAQLDHPGIVPVHELGLDDDGRVYFTMRLVKGRNLLQIIDLLRAGKEEWTLTRALMAMLKVCDAMAYAHAKGVVHRDLKPENIMVGRFGEVYVMDWGLARVMGREDLHDIRIDTDVDVSIVESDRKADESRAADSTLFTMDGDVVGTPAYMSPEQARGEIERLGPRSDVFSVGSMLYHLITGEMPYVPPDAKVSQHMVLRWVMEGPPRPVHELRSDVPVELAAICEKAMARDMDKRYADMSELAKDLRAYLEHRVVKAYETGAVAEFRKWVVRNKALATTSAAALLLALGGLGATGYVQARGKEAERELRQVAEENELEARRQEELAREERAKVLRLSTFQILADLETEAATLWPALPEGVPAYDAWLERASALAAGLEPDPTSGSGGHLAMLAELRGRALPTVEEEGTPTRAWRFADNDDAWWHGQLEKLVREIEAFTDPESGLVSGISERWGWGIERRREFARTLERNTVAGERANELWDAARVSIADVEECPDYDGLELAPQLGLLPLGRDPDSGLWEFADLATGEPPERDGAGGLVFGEASGLVFVLLPGGRFSMGAQNFSPTAENHDPEAQGPESPVHPVELDPYFLSKYEMTQGQWRRFTGGNPSKYFPGGSRGSVDFTHPVEQVSWQECTDVLAQLGMQLPTEAQWEYAARAGTEEPWSSGDDRRMLKGFANLADAHAHASNPGWAAYEDWLDDDYLIHAPVGSFEPNPFGLHDVHGNQFEWCRDLFGDYFSGVSEGDGERQVTGASVRVLRGGGFNTTAPTARSSARNSATPDLKVISIGVRPARRVDG